MAFKYATANYLLIPSYFARDDERSLLSWLGRRHDLDLVDRVEGSVTIHAHLRHLPGGTILMEGVHVETETIPAGPVVDVATAWKAFAERVRKTAELEAFRDRRDHLRREAMADA